MCLLFCFNVSDCMLCHIGNSWNIEAAPTKLCHICGACSDSLQLDYVANCDWHYVKCVYNYGINAGSDPPAANQDPSVSWGHCDVIRMPPLSLCQQWDTNRSWSTGRRGALHRQGDHLWGTWERGWEEQLNQLWSTCLSPGSQPPCCQSWFGKSAHSWVGVWDTSEHPKGKY